MKSPVPYVFGEVLFDCFPSGDRVLGGAPFNVAWHLQALGDRPQFISRLGADALGSSILEAMREWGMSTAGIQIDPLHPTGRVDVALIDQEPSYTIVPDCAYDFIDSTELRPLPAGEILYHGTLGLRHPMSRAAFNFLAQNPELAIFLDVNLRSPWWHKEEVFQWLARARWVKLNQDELGLLEATAADPRQAMAKLQTQFRLEQVILTRGERGALVRTADGEFHSVAPETVTQVVDTVGAGDAFSAIYLHGLISGWPIATTLAVAQRFAIRVIGLRGATTTELDFYHEALAGSG